MKKTKNKPYGRSPSKDGAKFAKIVNSALKKKPRVSARGCKAKGSNFERECVAALLAGGVFAERVPLSGAAGGNFSGDVNVYLNMETNPIYRKFECKIRHRAWSDLYGWLKGNYGLFIRTNQNETLVVLRLSDFVQQHGIRF